MYGEVVPSASFVYRMDELDRSFETCRPARRFS